MMSIEEVKRFSKKVKMTYRVARGNRIDQAILSEFLERIKPESKIHREAKLKIAREMTEKGKKVLVERALNLDGIRTRPDICFLEDGKWNIIEIEYGNDHQNNIFKNYDAISKIANIKVINARNV
jgi:hypothetical protein